MNTLNNSYFQYQIAGTNMVNMSEMFVIMFSLIVGSYYDRRHYELDGRSIMKNGS
jgi:hypothetical protein